VKRILLTPVLFVALLAAQSIAAMAQTDITVPGGATGSNVFCIQAGDIGNGAYVGTFLQTGPGTWEERLKAGAFKLTEKKRNDLAVDLSDSARSAAITFDFVNKTIKYKAASSKDPNGRERYYILNATDKEHSNDCASLAEANAGGNSPGGGGGGGGPGAGGGGPGGGGGGGGGPGGGYGPNFGPGVGPGSFPQNMTQVPPRMLIDIPPGTEFSAIAGPPCPGNPGMFLCPNRFSCAPIGGVCCPGVGTCGPGQFCDHWIRGNCIGPGNPRFCGATGDPGIAVHCAPGKVCAGNNFCQ
jgi:hypothetical protein